MSPLTRIMLDELHSQGPGQHATEPLLARVFERCRAAGLNVTMADVRKEFRDVAGYP